MSPEHNASFAITQPLTELRLVESQPPRLRTILSPAEQRRQEATETRSLIDAELASIELGSNGERCVGKDSYYFIEDEDDKRLQLRKEQVAKAICAGCPVVNSCLEESLVDYEIRGTWGGVTERERQRLMLHSSSFSINSK
ncbi:MAG: WhiB family transcriptional regulator [Patescibacteria group bacterium]|nr:WhiB family transcriptional regulator [Patescibacteria group bacterium]